MPMYQSFNKRNKCWVKYKLTGKKSKIVDQKQRNPTKPFKGIKKR